jgi:hypothetical protein
MRIVLNVNDTVSVRLTDAGKKIFDAYYGGKLQTPPVSERIKFPLWELMQIFGKHIHLGACPFFDGNDIELRLGS